MTRQNMHIHSKYSWDSKMEIEEIARILYENGIRYGAITDHIEFDRESLPDVINKFKIRNLEIDKINELYEGRVTLLKAVEISSPHLYPDKVEALEELELDFIMGSIHDVEKNAKTNYDKIHANYLYYCEMLKMIEKKQIDVVAHLDYIDRHSGKGFSSMYQVMDIIKAITENNLIVEINTSAQRRAGFPIFPSFQKLCSYKLTGNSEIIIGTDAHRYDELLDNLEYGESITNELELKTVIYQKRKRIIL